MHRHAEDDMASACVGLVNEHVGTAVYAVTEFDRHRDVVIRSMLR